MRQAIAVVAYILLLRILFLNQAIQGDDVNYLAAAQHAQVDPLHPSNFRFVFQGQEVSMQGHPHPPFNSWFLAAILAIVGDIREVPFHAAFILFSLIAGLSALALAHRFSPHPLTTCFLAITVPAFMINGNSLESDLPLMAWWLAVAALYIRAVDKRSWQWLSLAVITMPLVAMSGFQSVVLAPVLALYLWRERKDWIAGWLAIAVIPGVLVGWQVYERLTTEQLPAQVLAGYFTRYGLQTLQNKGKNALALTAHLGWMCLLILPKARWWTIAPLAFGVFIDPHPLFWIPFTAGVVMLVWCVQHRREFAAQWVLLFFAAALIVFFAGSARYLLPIAVPAAILLGQQYSDSRKYVAAITFNIAVGVALSFVNYQHWDGYRQLIDKAQASWGYAHVWINSELGLLYYAESAGAVPLKRDQAVSPGDIVVTSKLASPVPFTTGGGVLVPVSDTQIQSTLPLRLIALGSRSGYSTANKGFRVFDVQGGAIDIVTIQSVAARKPTLSFVSMRDPESESHIISGLDKIENDKYRWMAKRALLLLKRPPSATPIAVDLFLHETAPAREITIRVDGVEKLKQVLPGPGAHTLTTAPIAASGEDVTLSIEVDKTYSVAGDERTLGVIVVAAGFR